MSVGMTAVMRQQIEKEEKRIGEPLETAHEMLAASPGLLTKYFMAAPLFGYNKAAPADVAAVTRIAALRVEDCGPCVLIGIAYARDAGVAEAHLKLMRQRRYDDLPHDLSLAANFGDAVARSLPEVVELGEAVERAWGRAGRVELALAAATSRVHPAMKRGLGIARNCAIPDADD